MSCHSCWLFKYWMISDYENGKFILQTYYTNQPLYVKSAENLNMLLKRLTTERWFMWQTLSRILSYYPCWWHCEQWGKTQWGCCSATDPHPPLPTISTGENHVDVIICLWFSYHMTRQDHGLPPTRDCQYRRRRAGKMRTRSCTLHQFGIRDW